VVFLDPGSQKWLPATPEWIQASIETPALGGELRCIAAKKIGMVSPEFKKIGMVSPEFTGIPPPEFS